ncbi:MAG: ribonuclease H-like YkuK family protein, partial [Patescibacteria group bacterium]|nr:ribonuclease H-like YkuK family protein [Patescibacteria group bacterium]
RVSEIFELRPRMWQEAWISIELAKTFIENFGFIPEAGRQIEIHVDIGNNGPTRELIKEIVGMVVGNGFEVKTKPEAFAASKVADRHVVNI